MSFVSIIDARKSITSLAAAATLSGQAESGGGEICRPEWQSASCASKLNDL